MRRKVQLGIAISSALFSIFILLFIIGSTFNVRQLILISGIAIVAIILVGTYVALRSLNEYSGSANRAATRLKNLESVLSTRGRAGGFSFRDAREDSAAATKEFSTMPEAVEFLGDSLELAGERHNALECRQSIAQEQLINVFRQLKVLRNRVPADFLEPVDSQIEELKENTLNLLRSSFEAALLLRRNPQSAINLNQARQLFRDYLDRNELLQLSPLIESFGLLEEQNLSTLRRLYRFYKRTGYWELASLVIDRLHEKTGLDSDAQAAMRLQHEIEVFARPDRVTVDLERSSSFSSVGPILHIVGRVLPETQTGYTLRTQYTARAQADRGLPVAIVGQSGITERNLLVYEHYEYQDIDYYLLPGPNRLEVLLDEWLRHNIEQLSLLVDDLRPSVLHAQSDFFNALIVSAVGTAKGIPTVYESRGFWEDSWLSRTITANDWDDPERLFEMYGLPTAYKYRKHAEEIARLLPDHVFTLADVMRDYILESPSGALEPSAVTIVPNAVDSENFPVQKKDVDIAREIGLPLDAITVGYISSMVEYEGVEDLIDAFQTVSEISDKPISLLLVGDGDHLPVLKQRVVDGQIVNVFFTGRVPHEDVLKYYGLIDIFVVPRKPSTVADLVTPLKPFEAFSTGRAVILSDVRALREIADQSDAVEVFRAGDSADLARVIMSLVNDRRKRQELQERAARWVRNYRSWEGNVQEYYRVYRELGYEGHRSMLIEAELTLKSMDLNPGELLEALTRAHLPPLSGWFTIQDSKQTAKSILEDGWRFASFDPVIVTDIEDWAQYGAEHRSWGFHLHAWEFLDPLLHEYENSAEPDWLEQAVNITLNWAEKHSQPGDPEDPMVWYDMSLALRMPRLIALVMRSARVKHLRAETLILAAVIGRHFRELELDRAYNPNNNHGFYTAVSQVHAAKYAKMFGESKLAEKQGNERLAEMAVTQFAADGVHLEHSPDYHRMLLNSFELAVNDDLIQDNEIRARVERAARVLGWMVQPDGALVQFGDSPETRMVKKRARSIDSHTQYILSDGQAGQKPEKELSLYTEGGYAFVRSPQPEPNCLHNSSYLAFSAAFHSRAHKHADDLNVVWYDRGQQILTDSGRFGYGELLPIDSPLRQEGFYYAAPERQYVEGTMAHNTLMMGNDDHERRTRKPYGSGIIQGSHENGEFDLMGRVQHLDYIHRRRVILRPGTELILKDSVYSQSPDKRDATIWLNISGHFEVEVDNEGPVFVSYVDGVATRMRVEGPGELISPVRGSTNPLRGWRSRYDRELEPTWSLGFTFPVETRASVETVLRFLN